VNVRLKDLTPDQKAALLSEAMSELGSRGGTVTAQRMTQEERTARAQKAALARWGK
jgi:hypothetical protein